MERKFFPFMVKVCAAAPTVADEGERLVMAGTGLLTVKLIEFEAPPPGEGFVTTTANVPAAAWSLALSGMVN